MEVYRGNKIKRLIKNNLSKKSPSVLDIGCGLNNLFFKFKNYTGIDIQDYNVRKYKILIQNLNEQTRLPFKKDAFDVVLATELLEHLFRPDLVAAEINRVVKPNGIIIISLPNEFTLNCRMGFLLNKVLNHGFVPYTHKYIFNVQKIEEFMNDYFLPVERDLACMGHFWQNMPDPINDFLANVNPSFFAKSLIYACKKKS